jgi:hypothetical protein
MILDLQKTEKPGRAQPDGASLAKETKDVPIDMLARMIKMLPPPFPYDKIDTDVVKLDIKCRRKTGSYYLQLPPDYHHRALIPCCCFCTAAQKPADMIRAHRVGRPARLHRRRALWGKGLRPAMLIAPGACHGLDTLRDLRRRFRSIPIASSCWAGRREARRLTDIGLSHPDQFAGVLPMNGKPSTSPRVPHESQYLPFYAVDGDQNGATASQTREIFKIGCAGIIPACTSNIRGARNGTRGTGHHVRLDEPQTPSSDEREIGRPNNAGFSGEEFKTMRLRQQILLGRLRRHPNAA